MCGGSCNWSWSPTLVNETDIEEIRASAQAVDKEVTAWKTVGFGKGTLAGSWMWFFRFSHRLSPAELFGNELKSKLRQDCAIFDELGWEVAEGR